VGFDFTAAEERVHSLLRHGKRPGIAAHRVDPFDRCGVGFADEDLIVQLQGDAERVKAGTEIGGGGRHTNGDRRFSHGGRYCMAVSGKSIAGDDSWLLVYERKGMITAPDRLPENHDEL